MPYKDKKKVKERSKRYYQTRKHKCKECDKLIGYYNIRCKKCNGIFYSAKKSWNYINGKSKNNKCADCGESISYEAFRCHSCASKNIRLTVSFFGNKNPNYKEGKLSDNPNICIDCKEIIDYRAIRCKQCYYKYNIGVNNPAYIHGKGNLPYSEEFTDKLKESIRKRDNYTCQHCGMTEEEHLIVLGRILSVHHIDYNKENCKETNLICICCGCNTRANFNMDYWNEFYIGKIREIYIVDLGKK